MKLELPTDDALRKVMPRRIERPYFHVPPQPQSIGDPLTCVSCSYEQERRYRADSRTERCSGMSLEYPDFFFVWRRNDEPTKGEYVI